MEALVLLVALVPIALLVMLGILLGRTSELSRELRNTRSHMERLTAQLEHRTGGPENPLDLTFSPKTAASTRAITPEQEVSQALPMDPTSQGVTEDLEEITDTVIDAANDTGPTPVPTQEVPRRKADRRPFFERHPDLERFIGENLINKVGIAVLVIGIGLLLRYAVGRGLIGETGRTLIGLAAGGALLFFAHRLRENYRAFSSVLVAGSIAVFYFTITIAFHQYRLIGQTPAFITMVGITSLAVLLTLAYDRRELAVIALLGGFASPFMASSGEGNFRVLFTYLLILDVGMLVLANYKKWPIINMLSFGLTTIIFGAWTMASYPDLEPRPTWVAFGFASAFFLVFFSMNLLYDLRRRMEFRPIDHALLLLNTGAYYGLGMHLLGHVEPKVTGLFTVLLGLFYLLFALRFHRATGIPRALKLLLVGLVLTFISLAAPVQLEGDHITLFWAAEAVLMLWFSQRTGLRLVQRGSFVVLGLMLISLMMDIMDTYSVDRAMHMHPLVNTAWVTGMVAVGSLVSMSRLLASIPSEETPLPGLPAKLIRTATGILAAGVFYIINHLELHHFLWIRLDPPAVSMALMLWSLFYFLVLERLSAKRTPVVQLGVTGLLLIAALLYITRHYADSRTTLSLMLMGEGGQGFFLLHYASLALMVTTLVRIARVARALIGRGRPGWDVYLWTMCTYLVILASQELDHLMLWADPPGTRSIATALADGRRAGFPILWGLGSFLFMWYGMQHRMRTIRLIALVLFAITLLKLFLVDLRDLGEGGRVAAFIVLGALLLVISFMYQRLKELLRDDAPVAPRDPSDAHT